MKWRADLYTPQAVSICACRTSNIPLRPRGPRRRLQHLRPSCTGRAQYQGARQENLARHLYATRSRLLRPTDLQARTNRQPLRTNSAARPGRSHSR